MRRLEIGGGYHPAEGYEQINEGWGHRPLPFPDATFSEVYTSHTIEHVPWWLVQDAMHEAARVLVIGGSMEVHTVDFNYLVSCYMDSRCGDKWPARGKNPDMHPIRWLSSRIFSVGDDLADPNWHRGILDQSYLLELFTEAGFVEVTAVYSPKGPMKHGPINMGMRGVKA